MIFGRTDLRTGGSEAKFDGEADFEVRSAVAPQKPCEKLIFRSKNDVEKKLLASILFFIGNRLKRVWATFRCAVRV